MKQRLVMLRLMARCASAQEAEDLEIRLLAALAAFKAQRRSAPVRYWKMPELFEFTLVVPGTEQLKPLTALCSEGWTAWGDDVDPSHVWNATPGATFLHANVQWAELLLADA